MTRFVLGALALIAGGWAVGAQAADVNYRGRDAFG